MADERKEPWLNLLALTTVILAVCATLATFKGGGYSTRSILSQSRASDQWAFYQAKSIKGHTYEMAKEKLELDLKALGPKAPEDVVAAYRKKLEDYGRSLAKYEAEKAAIQAEAKACEASRDEAQRFSQAFGKAVIYLQIGILLSSIAALLKRKPVYYLGLAVGAIGFVTFAYSLCLTWQGAHWLHFWPMAG